LRSVSRRKSPTRTTSRRFRGLAEGPRLQRDIRVGQARRWTTTGARAMRLLKQGDHYNPGDDQSCAGAAGSVPGGNSLWDRRPARPPTKFGRRASDTITRMPFKSQGPAAQVRAAARRGQESGPRASDDAPPAVLCRRRERHPPDPGHRPRASLPGAGGGPRCSIRVAGGSSVPPPPTCSERERFAGDGVSLQGWQCRAVPLPRRGTVVLPAWRSPTTAPAQPASSIGLAGAGSM